MRWLLLFPLGSSTRHPDSKSHSCDSGPAACLTACVKYIITAFDVLGSHLANSCTFCKDRPAVYGTRVHCTAVPVLDHAIELSRTPCENFKLEVGPASCPKPVRSFCGSDRHKEGLGAPAFFKKPMSAWTTCSYTQTVAYTSSRGSGVLNPFGFSGACCQHSVGNSAALRDGALLLPRVGMAVLAGHLCHSDMPGCGIMQYHMRLRPHVIVRTLGNALERDLCCAEGVCTSICTCSALALTWHASGYCNSLSMVLSNVMTAQA